MRLSKVAIVGGAGFIGTHVVAAVQDTGGLPIVVGEEQAPHLDCEVRVADAANIDALTESLAGCTSVIHLAARAGGIQMQHSAGVFETNRLITDNVLEACLRNGIRHLFLASSQVVYRESPAAVDESSPLVSSVDDPSEYAWSKATDEVVCRWWGEEHGARVVIGRLGNIYGPGAPYSHDRSTVVHALVQRFAEALHGSTVEVWGDGSAVRSLLFVEDAARAIVTVLRNGTPGSVYNIDSGEPLSIRDLAGEINRQIGNDIDLVFDPTKPSGVPYRVGAIDKLHGIGFQPDVRLEVGLAVTIADFRSRYPHGR